MKNIKEVIEKHLIEFLPCENIIISEIDAKVLLVPKRLDIAFKLFYLDTLKYHPKLAVEVYAEHIRAFSLGSYVEPGNSAKSSLNAYLSEFDSIFKDITSNGFNSEKSLVPVSKKGVIVNGAHRVASAIKANKKITCIELAPASPEYDFDYKYFLKRKVPLNIVEIAVNKFIELSSNVYIAFIWPNDLELGNISNHIDNILYQKNIRLNVNGAHNLLSMLYKGEDWLGCRSDNYPGVIGKLTNCFKNFDKDLQIIAFQATNLKAVLNIKDNIRKIANVGKHSIHITDSQEEAVDLSKIIFNDNGVDFLNAGKPNKYVENFELIKSIRASFEDGGVSVNDFSLDSGSTLSVFGIRKSNDIDYFLSELASFKPKKEEFEEHDSELVYHKQNKETLLYDPRFYFIYEGVKFVSLKQVSNMKVERGSAKDVSDVLCIKSITDNNKWKIFLGKLIQQIYYLQLYCKVHSITTLKKIGLYNSVRFIYRKVKGK